MLTGRRSENYYSILCERKSISSNAGRITNSRLFVERSAWCAFLVLRSEKTQVGFDETFSSDTMYFFFVRPSLFVSFRPLPFFVFLPHNWKDARRTVEQFNWKTLGKCHFQRKHLFVSRLRYCCCLPCDTQYTLRDWRTQATISDVKSSAACADQIYAYCFPR